MDTAGPPGARPGPLLAVCACEQLLHIAVGEASGHGTVELLTGQRWNTRGRSMGLAASAIADGLSRLRLTVADLGGLAVVRGPGSFTGLRISLSLSAGLAAGAPGLPVAGLEYLSCVAAGAAPAAMALATPGTTLAVLTRARKNLVYYQAFTLDGLAPLNRLEVLTPAAAAESLAALQSPVLAVGSGIRLAPEAIAEGAPAACTLPTHFDAPSVEALLSCAATAHYGTQPVDALYARPSDAEDNLPALAPARGLTAEQARERLRKARG